MRCGRDTIWRKGIEFLYAADASDPRILTLLFVVSDALGACGSGTNSERRTPYWPARTEGDFGIVRLEML
jgi:hypothetical protein